MAYVFRLAVISLLITLVCTNFMSSVHEKLNKIIYTMETANALHRHDVDRMDRSLTSFKEDLSATKSHVLELKKQMDSVMTKLDSLNEAFKLGLEEVKLEISALSDFEARINKSEADLNKRLTAYGLKEGIKVGKHGKSIYVRPRGVADYDSAAKICSNIGGYLVEISSEQENAFIKQTFFHSMHIHLGGSDRIKEGDWKWAHSGDRIPMRNQTGFQKWGTDSPSNYNSDYDCLRMGWHGEWYDTDCQYSSWYVCEVDLI